MKGFFREFRRINWRKTLFGSKKRTGISLLIIIPVLVGIAGFGYQYYLQLNPAVVYQHKLQAMTDQVSKSVALPKDETPVVATVTDKNLLPKEKFFSYAKDGDKIIMYKKHQLAVLYRPSVGAVITQAKLEFRDVTPTPANPATAVAGASTSVSVTPATTVVPTVSPTVPAAPTTAPSGTGTYHPQGKVLVQPQ